MTNSKAQMSQLQNKTIPSGIFSFFDFCRWLKGMSNFKTPMPTLCSGIRAQGQDMR